MTVSELVILEPERSVARKPPNNLGNLRKLIKAANLRIVPNPSTEEVEANLYLMIDPNDVPILFQQQTTLQTTLSKLSSERNGLP